MPNAARIAKCPYYIRENRIVIYCEGYVSTSCSSYVSTSCVSALGGSSCTSGVPDDTAEGLPSFVSSYAHIFKREGEKAQYFRRHCERYPDMDCIYATHMNKLYEIGTTGRGMLREEKDKGKKVER